VAAGEDLHALDPDEFAERVHSFEFWFESVEGYLQGLEHGHRPETPEAELTDEERDRLVTVLCNYCVGETAALEGAGALIQIAPNRASKVFLSTQAADEGRHLEVLVHRLRELGVTHPEGEIERRASPQLVVFHDRLLELVKGHDWAAAVFAQNVILEAMEFSVFQLHARRADPRTREMLEGIVKDERRHIGFGENELGRRLKEDALLRPRLTELRHELDARVLDCFREIMLRIGVTREEQVELGRHYLQAVGRLGFA
jgi:1,2-phenylacetyl-CoA epoxidase catalytic subunit